ncbi:MAG: hypothetical protein HOL85_21395 [Rhodospirillaceae bacterium]|nr:hypothetical protein [Rhodospirillaceae bacterium]MBT6136549.1 hypothetical protein [Rhodospirillaceae bacterium]
MLTFGALHTGIVYTFGALLVTAAVHDSRFFLIPNWLCLVVALIFPIYATTSSTPVLWPVSLATAGVVLIFGLIAFARGWLGGGDVKLLAAVSLWAGLSGLSTLFIVMTVAGGALTMFVVTLTWARSLFHLSPVGAASPAATIRIPYGIAIAAGGLALIPQLLSV